MGGFWHLSRCRVGSWRLGVFSSTAASPKRGNVEHVTVAEVMTPEVESIDPTCPFSEVIQRMSERRLSCVVVCDKELPVGIVSERDVVGARHLAEVPVAEVMSRPILTVSEDTSVGEAVGLIRQRRIRRLPVVDREGHLSGIVTQTDILDAYVGELECINRELEHRVADRTRELRDLAERFEALSLEDALLRIGNRRAMETTLDQTHAEARRYGRVYTLALLDVDHFKSFNDTYGHAEGDRVLLEVASCLRKLMRGADAVFRYGGEEFLVLLPETSSEGARSAVERLCRAVEDLAIPHRGSPRGAVTVSCGVATVRIGAEPSEHWGRVVEHADLALYRAKQSGRNRVELHTSEGLLP